MYSAGEAIAFDLLKDNKFVHALARHGYAGKHAIVKNTRPYHTVNAKPMAVIMDCNDHILSPAAWWAATQRCLLMGVYKNYVCILLPCGAFGRGPY